MSEVTTQEGVETPEQEPETPVTQPPGESPESPEPGAPPKPGEAPAEPPEQKPEPESDPDDSDGEAKAKPSLPENATRAGRKRASAKSQKAKPRGKAKTTKQTDKEKEEKKKLDTEYKALQQQVKDRGHTAAMQRKMRTLAEKLGRNVPKWATVGSKAKDPDAPKRADDPDLQIAHQMTAYATGGKVVDGRVVVGDVKFGAAVSARQVKLMRAELKGKDVLKFLHVTEAKLASYAAGKIKAVDLPQEARDAIKALNGRFDPSLKMWARKDAVIALFIHRERKAAKKSAPKAEEREAVAA